ncbi:MAG: hypothetical protein ACOH2E_00220 [Candidatus Paracaedibacter sp.]
MLFLEKKIVYTLPTIAFHLFLSISAYASDEQPGFFDSLFDSPKKTPHKTFSVPVPLPSHNTQISQAPQMAIPQQVNQRNEQVSTFLQTLPKILRDMSELERHIPTLIPEHRLNPKNVCRQPKSGDWRVFMACSIEGELKKFKTINEILEDLNKKKVLEKEKGLKNNPQGLGRQNISTSVEEINHAGPSKLPDMLRLWFYHTCNPSSQILSKHLKDYKHFTQWWNELPPQFMISEEVLLLNSLLQQKEDNSAIILSLLDNLLVESLLLRVQPLYEGLLPTFMDLKTSNATLHSLKEEAFREDALLKEILENGNLYKQIEAHIASAIKAAVMPLMENCLKETTDDQLRRTVKESFEQALRDALNGKWHSPSVKSSKESQDFEDREAEAATVLKENLRKVIVNVIREAIQAGLNQATGRVKKDEPVQSSSYWKSSSKSSSQNKIDFLNNHSLTLNIAPIEQILAEFIKPPEHATSHSGSWYWSSSNKSPVAHKFISVNIPTNIKKRWEIPSRMETRSQQDIRKFPEVDDITPIIKSIFTEIRGLRNYESSRLPSPSLNLQEFINQKNSVRFLFDLPRAYVYSPSIEGASPILKIFRFFEEYEALISNYGKDLQKISKSDLSLYLDPTRLSSKFCKSNKDSLFSVFPLLDPMELMHDWISIEVVSLLDRKFLEGDNKNSFVAELEENIFLLAMVDGFADESLKMDTLDISRLIRNAKKILLFKEKYLALKGGKLLPLEEDKQALSDKLFQEKCDAVKEVNEAVQRILILEKSKIRPEDKSFKKDRDVLVPFFTELFRQILTECLYGFGLTDEKLETLKRISSPLEQKLGDDQKVRTPVIRSLNSSDSSASKEDGEVTLHVPITFQENSRFPKKKTAASGDRVQKQKEDETGLPPIQKLDLQEMGSLFDPLK